MREYLKGSEPQIRGAMNDSETSLKHQPFGKLGKRLKTGMGSCHSLVPKSSPKPDPDSSTENDEGAFLKAMQGVKVIARDKFAGKRGERQAARLKIPKPDMIAMTDLDNLIKYGEGFIVANTPEYMAGTGQTFRLRLLKIASGRFSPSRPILIFTGWAWSRQKGPLKNF